MIPAVIMNTSVGIVGRATRENTVHSTGPAGGISLTPPHETRIWTGPGYKKKKKKKTAVLQLILSVKCSVGVLFHCLSLHVVS